MQAPVQAAPLQPASLELQRSFFLRLLDARIQQLERVPKLLEPLVLNAWKKSGKKRFFVAIDGGIGSGKSRAAKELTRRLMAKGVRVVRIPFDDYLWSRSEREGQKHDDWFKPVVARHLAQMSHGYGRICKPVYDRRTGLACEPRWVTIARRAVVLVEGVYLLGEQTRKFFDLKILLEADREVRLKRFTERSLRLSGLPSEHSLRRFTEVTEPTYLPYLERVREFADVRISTDDFDNPQILSIKPRLQQITQ